MNRVAAVAVALFAFAAAPEAQADPYRWCAHYSGNGGNGTNCYFMTIEQCRWAISGVGGYCAPNPFFDGTPIGQPSRPKR